MSKYKYVIVSPPTSFGGTIALHALCRYLCQHGEDAKIFYLDVGYGYKNSGLVWLYALWYSVKSWVRVLLHKEPTSYMLNCPRKWLPFVGKNTIVVYPEITRGNFLNSKHVVRWLLFRNKIYTKEGEKTIGYNKNDLFFSYREAFNDPQLNPEKRILTITHFDLDTYKRYNYGERSGKCYIIRKGSTRSDVPEKPDGPVIDYLPEAEKVRYFNECEYCICYDTQTAYSQIAALCGCVSVVIPEEGKTKADYRHGGDNVFDTGYGEAFGFSQNEIEYAKDTASQLLKLFKKSNEDSAQIVAWFAKECEQYFDRV